MSLEIPYVPKDTVTILVVGDSAEGIALRAALEAMNYKVTLHHASSRKEFLEVLSGNIPTDQKIILSCHGIPEGIDVPDEKPLAADELSTAAKLEGKIIVNLGCHTGSPEFQAAFKKAGAASYIAPTGYPEGAAALIFTIALFYHLKSEQPIKEAVSHASQLDDETKQFQQLI